MNRILVLIGMASALAFAQTTTPVHTQAEIDAHRAKIDQAITDRNYDAWKAEHDAWNPNDDRLDGKVTRENFEKFAKMREARKNGDMTTAKQLRDELGIPAGGNGKGMGKGKGNGNGSGKGKGQGKHLRSGACDGTGAGAGQSQGRHGK